MYKMLQVRSAEGSQMGIVVAVGGGIVGVGEGVDVSIAGDVLVESDRIDSSIDGSVIGSEIGVQEYIGNRVRSKKNLYLFMVRRLIVQCDLRNIRLL